VVKTVLIGISLTMAVGLYYPLYRRIWRRRHTRDFSKAAQWFVTLLQVNGGILAYVEQAPYLVFWYAVQTVLTAVQLWMIYRFWDVPSPDAVQKVNK